MPVEEQIFLIDQRSNRKMYITGIDFVAEKQKQLKQRRTKTEWVSTSNIDQTENNITGVTDPQINVSPNTVNEQSTLPRNTRNINKLAETIVRFNVSPTAGAAIASSALECYGIVSEDNTSNVIDRSKVRRAIKTVERNLNNVEDRIVVKRLYFDGRKDRTKTYQDKRVKIVVEEHISLVNEPGSGYLGHVSPPSGML